jgi:hypothetical protein
MFLKIIFFIFYFLKYFYKKTFNFKILRIKIIIIKVLKLNSGVYSEQNSGQRLGGLIWIDSNR